MSSTVSAPLRPDAASASATSTPQGHGRWWREPLLHFVVLGGLLFLADHQLVSRAGDPQTIVVGKEVDDEARQTFKLARGREPDAKELAALRRVWLDNEVLYREGLALQVDKGDAAIRDRVIFKALSVVDANTKLPPVTEAGLRHWFEAHRSKYDEPARFDFQEAVLAGENSESRVRAFVEALNAGRAPADAEAGLRVFKGRPLSNLDQSYGPEFARTLREAPPEVWQAVKTKDGWHAFRLLAVSAAKPAEFEKLRNVVQQDWTDATLSEQRSAAVKALMGKYRIQYEGDAK